MESVRMYATRGCCCSEWQSAAYVCRRLAMVSNYVFRIFTYFTNIFHATKNTPASISRPMRWCQWWQRCDAMNEIRIIREIFFSAISCVTFNLKVYGSTSSHAYVLALNLDFLCSRRLFSSTHTHTHIFADAAMKCECLNILTDTNRIALRFVVCHTLNNKFHILISHKS